MSFTHYHCANGFAKPVNPFDYDSTVEYTAYERFAIFAKENTVSCSEDLSGEYAVEDFYEPIKQVKTEKGWHKIENGHAEIEYNLSGLDSRQYIELKPVEKEMEVKQIEFKLNDIRDNMSKYWGFQNFKHMDQNSCFTIKQIEILMEKAFELGQKS